MFKHWFYDRLGNPKFPDITNAWFMLGLVLKLAASLFFASDYLRDLFSPFVDYFLATGEDPYAHFNQTGNGNEFPYPPLMLAILSVGRALTWVFGAFDPNSFGMADALGLRLPLLAADFAIFLVLARWFRNKHSQVLYFYWLSPLAFYISYMHGQLDVIPMAFLFVSLHFLFRRKLLWSAVLFACAFGCKTHLILVFPFYGWYLWKNAEKKKSEILLPILTLVVCALLIHFPYFSADYVAMVFQNEKQNQVFDLFYQFNPGLKFLFIPATLLLLISWYVSLRFVNKDQLLLFVGFSFLALTVMIAPMQGWYYWILPFMVFFVLRHGSATENKLFIAINTAYFLYFLVSPTSDFGKLLNPSGPVFYENLQSAGLPAENILYLCFTIMQTSLLVFAWLVYKNGIRQNIQTKFLSQPYLLGIGGDSASGKSTLSEAMVQLFGNRNAGVVRGDDMHKWERGDEKWTQWTHLNPQANYLHENMKQSLQLKQGNRVRRSHYDHHTGKFSLPQFIEPKKLVIFEGLHSFYLQNQADIYDLKIFMYPDEDLRKFWKIRRDVQGRGYAAEKVQEQLESRQEDSEKFIRIQAQQADILFRFYAVHKEQLQGDTEPEIGLKVRLMNHIDVDPVLEELMQYPELKVTQQYEEQFRNICFEGSIPLEHLDVIAVNVIPELEEVGIYSPEWEDNFSGIMQLMTTYVIFSKLKENEN